ncbi:MAG: hypothetical protein D6814_15025 [Calditrichaeota bacterium]|nr:MAG: hypothetical protein D6814_15025 [Calditrichota bacterium]
MIGPQERYFLGGMPFRSDSSQPQVKIKWDGRKVKNQKAEYRGSPSHQASEIMRRVRVLGFGHHIKLEQLGSNLCFVLTH